MRRKLPFDIVIFMKIASVCTSARKDFKLFMKPKIIVICGPTGVGKTSTAIGLALDFQGEIIGADSMQVYRHMDIGTAKPTPAEQARVPHRMIDVIDPDEPFDAARFSEAAFEEMNAVAGMGKIPFVVGGTGLYIKSLIHGLSRARPADADVLSRLKKEASEYGLQALHKRLAQCDPEAAAKIHCNDAFRIMRALEIFEVTGKPLSAYQKAHGFAPQKCHALKIGLRLDRAVLYDRINRRVDQMIHEGLLGEVKGLLDKGYSAELKAMQSIGYRHMAEHILNQVPWEETCQTLKRDTRRYAKRQMTWFSADPDIKWFAPDAHAEMHLQIKQFLNA